MDGLLDHSWIVRRKLDVHAYHRMGEAGILGPDDRVELLEGELVARAPIGPDHAGQTNSLAYRLFRAIGDSAVVTVGNPVRLDGHNEPQPDFALLRPRADLYRGVIVGPADVLLLIEVANSSLRLDRTVKSRLYARSAIPEYWIIDLAGRALERYRDPAPEGYARIERRTEGTIAPDLLPAISLDVADILA